MMNPPFTDVETKAIRDLVLRTKAPTDADISAVTTRPVSEVQQIITRLAKPFADTSLTNQDLTKLINDMKLRNVRLPPRIEPPAVPIEQPIHSANAFVVPPKFRGKPMAKTPTVSSHPQFAQFSNQTMEVQTTQSLSILPILPRYASSPPGISRHKDASSAPKIGSLAAVLHPTLGRAHVCRVLGSCIQNDTECFLVAFFQSEHSPCYVPGEYLFQLQPHIGLPLGDEEDFRKQMDRGDVNVDWLLERIFSAAQNLVIGSADVLFPPEVTKTALVQPNPQQVQQLMFQCVSCAALLIVCYVAGQWQIPDQRLSLILSTILKTSAFKYESSRTIIANVESTLNQLLLAKSQ